MLIVTIPDYELNPKLLPVKKYIVKVQFLPNTTLLPTNPVCKHRD